MSEYKQPVSVLVLIHTPALEVLLLERAGGNGLWQSVTGSREGDEKLAATALREVAEETGIQASPDMLIDWRLSNRFVILPRWRGRYAPGVTHNTEHVFSLCVPDAIPVQLATDEHTAALWLPWQTAAAKVFSWTNRDAIRLLPQRLNGAQQPPPAGA
ncbi:MAG: dihydroneopterin triphosphate diphosphatase [Proteobacteria bacterium]|nr:dihydroneopterin triphosphate diphosphatase [Pseudomonadota bacterium]